jgi:hypothetical protein
VKLKFIGRHSRNNEEYYEFEILSGAGYLMGYGLQPVAGGDHIHVLVDVFWSKPFITLERK